MNYRCLVDAKYDTRPWKIYGEGSSADKANHPKAVKSVELLGCGKVSFSQSSEGLTVKLSQNA